MIQEGAGRRFNVFNVPLSGRLPKFAMSPRHDFRFETHRKDSNLIGTERYILLRGECNVSFAISTHSHDTIRFRKGTRYSFEAQTRSRIAGFDMRNEADRGL